MNREVPVLESVSGNTHARQPGNVTAQEIQTHSNVGIL